MAEVTALISYPVGNVTFVFTDIEGSSRMTAELEKISLGMYERELRDPQRRKLRELAEKGHEVHRAGDGHLLVFQFADDALAFAVAFQQALHEKPITHPEGDSLYTIRVRIGIHTAAVQRESAFMENGLPEYPGDDTNYAARIGSLGIGGQIIVSQGTYTHARKLRDYEAPNDKHCAVHPWPGRFLKSFKGPHNVYEITYYEGQTPAEPGMRWFSEWYRSERNRFVDRFEKEQEVYSGFDTRGVRLVTITGIGGTGKTRLAIACAAKRANLYDDGVYFVSLATADLVENPSAVGTARDADFVAEAIGAALSRKGQDAKPEPLFQWLRTKKLLLVLDNYESVNCGEVSQYLIKIITETPGVFLLVTGREPVGGDDTETRVNLNDGMTEGEAGDLFLERARLKRQLEGELTLEEETQLSRILAMTERIPLALELAAAWIARLTLYEIAESIGDTPLGDVSTAIGARADDEIAFHRHRSLERSLQWSFNLLRPLAQRILALTSLFADTFDTAALKAAYGSADAVEGLYSIQDASLAYEDGSPLSAGRYRRFRLHRATREFALVKFEGHEGLFSAKERRTMRKKQATYFLELAEQTIPLLKASEPEKKQKVDALEVEAQNLNAALEWCEKNDVPRGLRIATDLWQFWWIRGYARMGMERILALRSEADKASPLSAEAASVAGHLARHVGEFTRARTLYDESLATYDTLNDPSGAARVLRHLGVLAWHENREEDARSLLDEALMKSEAGGRPEDIAESHYELGNLARHQDKLAEAAQHIEDSLVFFRKANDTRWTATALLALGNIAVKSQKLDEARSYYAESLALFDAIKDKGRLVLVFERIAALARLRDRADQAAILLGASEKLRERIGSPLPGPDSAEYHKQLVVDLKQVLGQERYMTKYSQLTKNNPEISTLMEKAVAIASEEVGKQQVG